MDWKVKRDSGWLWVKSEGAEVRFTAETIYGILLTTDNARSLTAALITAGYGPIASED